MASPQIERMRISFSKMSTVQKKVYIDRLREELQVQGKNNSECLKFLNECTQEYNAVIDAESKQKTRTLIVLLVLCSVALLALGAFVIKPISQYIASSSDGNSHSQPHLKSTIYGTTYSSPQISTPAPENDITYLKAFPDADFRKYVLSNVFGGDRTDSDIVSDTDIAKMAKWTDSSFDTGYINLTGMSYFTGLTNSESSSISSTDISASNSNISSSSSLNSSTSSSSNSSTSSEEESSLSASKPKNGTITISYDTKYTVETGTYTGELSDGKPSGQGTFKSNSSNYQYTGEWKDGVPNGQGSAYIAFGRNLVKFANYSMESFRGSATEWYFWGTYKGQFSNGKPDGYGRFNMEDGGGHKGGNCQGNWTNGYLNGTGTWTDNNGNILVGTFNNDVPDGIFEYTVVNPVYVNGKLLYPTGTYNYEIENGLTYGADLNSRKQAGDHPSTE